MSKYNYLKRPIGHNHDAPSDAWLDFLTSYLAREKAAVFAVNSNTDVYTLLRPTLLSLGEPWHSSLHRRAALGVALLCISGDESDWNWNEGRDTTAGPQRPEEMEAGPFQVSYDSRGLDESLRSFLVAQGVTDAGEFQHRMKSDHALACAYAARLLRVSTRWDGPCNRGWIAAQVKPEAVTELERCLLAVNPALAD